MLVRLLTPCTMHAPLVEIYMQKEPCTWFVALSTGMHIESDLVRKRTLAE